MGAVCPYFRRVSGGSMSLLQVYLLWQHVFISGMSLDRGSMSLLQVHILWQHVLNSCVFLGAACPYFMCVSGGSMSLLQVCVYVC